MVDEPGAVGTERLDTPEAVLNNLFYDMINDAVAPRSTTYLNETHTMTERKEAECRCKITAILETIEGGGAKYLECLNDYIRDCRERCARDVNRVRRKSIRCCGRTGPVARSYPIQIWLT